MKRYILPLLFISLAAMSKWIVPLPPGTQIVLPIRGVEVRDVRQPLPGDATTDTVIEIGIERAININTNGVSGTVQAIAVLQIAVSRSSIEQLTGMPVATAPHAANTNAVAQIAFSRLAKTIPVIAEKLSGEE